MQNKLFNKKKYSNKLINNINTDNINYTIDEHNRQINIEGQVYNIPAFFNFPNLIKGDKKTVDYVLFYFLDGSYKKCVG